MKFHRNEVALQSNVSISFAEGGHELDPMPRRASHGVVTAAAAAAERGGWRRQDADAEFS